MIFLLACAPRAIVTASTPTGAYSIGAPPWLAAFCLVVIGPIVLTAVGALFMRRKL